MAEILQPRAEEIFTLIHEEVVRAGFEKLLNAGVVLTGGGSVLPGMAEVAEQVFDLPVRMGAPAVFRESRNHRPARSTRPPWGWPSIRHAIWGATAGTGGSP
jgi:cell division ATPase FtsA